MTEAPHEHRDTVPCVLAVDVEPTLRRPERGDPGPWKGFRETVELLEAFRAKVAERTADAAGFVWGLRMDPQIEAVHGSTTWAVDRHPELTERIVASGDELGLHAHAWRWDDARDDWVTDHGDDDWVEHCLDVSFDAFQRSVGRRCVTYRSGDRFFSQRIVRSLEARGVEHDLTIEPGEPAQAGLFAHEAHTGALPDMRDAPLVPFQSENGLWFVPLTAGEWRPEAAPVQQALRRATTKLLRPIMRVPPYLWPLRAGPGTLRLWEAERVFRDALQGALAATPNPLLAFAIRTDMVLNPLIRRRMLRNLLALTELEIDVRFRTTAAALELWRERDRVRA